MAVRIAVCWSQRTGTLVSESRSFDVLALGASSLFYTLRPSLLRFAEVLSVMLGHMMEAVMLGPCHFGDVVAFERQDRCC